MPHFAKHLIVAISVAIPLSLAGIVSAQSPPVAPLAPATTLPLTTTMKFNYENAPIDTILDQMSQSFGFIIQKMTPLNGRISVSAPQPVTADEAIVLLNTLLRPLGYATIERPPRVTGSGTTARVLRVMTIDQAKKEAPVSK